MVPLIQRFAPDFIMVSSGFDAAFVDPLGSMMLSSDSYRKMAKDLIACAEQQCQGKISFAHEGGYSKEYVPHCAVALIEELLGVRGESVDDSLSEVNQRGYQELQLHQMAVVDKVAAICKLPGDDEAHNIILNQIQGLFKGLDIEQKREIIQRVLNE